MEGGSDLEGSQFLRAKDYTAIEQPVEAFINILFSSGTTGQASCMAFLGLVSYGKSCHFSLNGDAEDARFERLASIDLEPFETKKSALLGFSILLGHA